jgi:methionine transaminase
MASEKHSLSSEVEISFQSKLPGVGTTIFTVMSALAAKHNAINLGQGFPDIPGYEGLFKLVYEKMQGGKNQYAPMQGIPELRQAISEKINALYHHDYDPSQEIVITAGGTQALFTAITAFIHPGDEVIVFDPVYDCYEPAVELCGGKTIHIPMAPPDFRPDFDRIKAALSPKTKMVILNSPNNPAGSVWRKEDMQQLENLLMGTGIIVLSDEVYEHLVFHPEGHQSVARYPGLAQRSFLVASFGKTYHNTGWKIGYIAGP